MGLRFLLLVCITMLVVSISSITVNSQVEGCSLAGINLDHCLLPSDSLQFQLDSCCTSLKHVVKAGYYCLCSLLNPSQYPFFDTSLSISFSNCNISVPSVTLCPGVEPQPVVLPLPVDVIPQPIRMLTPPNLPRDDYPSTTDGDDQPERWAFVHQSNGGGQRLLLSTNLLHVAVFASLLLKILVS